MSDTLPRVSLTGVLGRLHAVADELQALELTGDTDPELADGLRELERLQRRLDSGSYGLVNEAARRGVPQTYGCRSTGRFLRHLLRLDPHTANSRAAAAEAAGPRVSLTGEVLPPVFPHVGPLRHPGWCRNVRRC